LNYTDGTYASEVSLATLGTGDGTVVTFTGAFTFDTITGVNSIRPTSVRVVANGRVVAQDDGRGNLFGTGVSGTVNYVTGAISVTFATAPATGVVISGQAALDSEQNTSIIREIEFQMTNVPVVARAHPLKYKISAQSQLIMASHLDIDGNDVLVNIAAGQIAVERDIFSTNQVSQAATLYPALNFDASATGIYYTLKDFYGNISLKIRYAADLIRANAGRGGVSYVLCGINAANIITQIPGFVPAPESEAPIGPYKAGTIDNGTIPVLVMINSGSLVGPNDFICGFKGYQMGDSAVILAEWIPLYFTALWESPNLINMRGLMSLYDLFINRPQYLVKGQVSNFNAGN